MATNSRIQSLYTLIAVILLVAMGVFAFYLVKSLLSALKNLPADTAVPLIVALIAGLVSVISMLIAKRLEIRMAIMREQREKKIPIYEQFMSFLLKDIVSDPGKEEAILRKQTVEFMQEFTPKLIVWGSDEVIKSYSNFRIAAMNLATEKDPKVLASSMILMENLFKSMRKDLGHSNKKIQTGDVLRLFINDIDKHLDGITKDKP